MSRHPNCIYLVITLLFSACMPEFPDPNLGVYPCSENGTCASGYYCSSGNKCLPNWMTDTGAGGGSSDATDTTDASDPTDSGEVGSKSCERLLTGCLIPLQCNDQARSSCVSQGTLEAQQKFTAWENCIWASCGAIGAYECTGDDVRCYDLNSEVARGHCAFSCQDELQACFGRPLPSEGTCRATCELDNQVQSAECGTCNPVGSGGMCAPNEGLGLCEGRTSIPCDEENPCPNNWGCAGITDG